MPNAIVVHRRQWWRPSTARPARQAIGAAVQSLCLELASKWGWMRPLMPLARLYLYMRGHLLFACYYRMLLLTKAGHLAVWNGQRYRQQLAVAAAQAQGLPCLFFENGLLPDHTTLDAQGVNYLNSMPRQAAAYLAKPALQISPVLCGSSGKFILVPFQVETDSQMLRFSPWIHTMRALVENLLTASSYLPPGWRFICKTHPAEPKRHRWLKALIDRHACLELAEPKATIQGLIYNAGAVITINSTVGIEALLAGKRVIVLGQAFYAIESMVLKARNATQLKQAIAHLPDWKPDSALVAAFLQHLSAYQVPGDWRRDSQTHYQAMRERIYQLMALRHAVETSG